MYDRTKIRAALALLGIKRLAFAIPNNSFPSLSDEELGCGSPYTHGGRAFVRFVHELGFDTLVLAPQGQARPTQPSPYLASSFSRSLLSLAPLPLCAPRVGLLSPNHLQRLVHGSPVGQGGAAADRVDLPYAWNSAQGLLEGAFGAFHKANESAEVLRQAFRHYLDLNLTPSGRLIRDALFFALAQAHGTEDWQRWPEQDRNVFATNTTKPDTQLRRVQALFSSMRRRVELYAFGQFLLEQQHEGLREEAQAMGLAMFAEANDNENAVDAPDCWAYGSAFPTYEIRALHLANGFDGLLKGGLGRAADWTATAGHAGSSPWCDDPNDAIAKISKSISSGATQVAVAFSDLLDLRQSHDQAGAPLDRVPADYARRYPQQAASGAALDLRFCLALVLRSKLATADALALAVQLESDASP